MVHTKQPFTRMLQVICKVCSTKLRRDDLERCAHPIALLRRSGYGGQVATLLKNWWWLAKIEISRLRFATLEMTMSHVILVLAHKPISATPIRFLDMTR